MSSVVIPLPQGDGPYVVSLTLSDNGTPIDLTDADVTVSIEGLDDVGVFVLPDQEDDNTGKIQIQFSDEDREAEVGVYEGDITVAWDDNTAVFPIQVSVSSLAEPETWATLSDVLMLTGKSVSQEDLRVAGSLIDLFSGRPYSMKDRLTARSRRLLKMATAWQATKQMSDSELVASGGSTAAIKSASNGKVSITYETNSSASDGLSNLLHPLAKRALMGLPQFSDKVVPLLPSRTRIPSFLLEASDDVDGRPWNQYTPGI